jgi:glutathione synthase/RimK-type ligase-like ATP-grasp enzyme
MEVVMPRIALASCAPFPPVVDDEGPLREALEVRGCEVVEPAWDKDFPWESVDAVLLRTTWDYHTRAAEFLAWCDRVSGMTRLFASKETVRWNIDKRYLSVLADRGLAVAETLWISPGEGAQKALEEARKRGWTRGFIKPVVGANAWSTCRFAFDEPGISEASRHLAEAPPGLGYMLQPYLEKVETEGELSVIVIDGAISHGVRKVPVPGDYRVQEDWGALDHAWVPTDEAVALAKAACEVASEVLGERLLYARVDFLRTAHGLVINELELIEPALFQRHAPAVGGMLAEVLLSRL